MCPFTCKKRRKVSLSWGFPPPASCLYTLYWSHWSFYKKSNVEFSTVFTWIGIIVSYWFFKSKTFSGIMLVHFCSSQANIYMLTCSVTALSWWYGNYMISVRFQSLFRNILDQLMFHFLRLQCELSFLLFPKYSYGKFHILLPSTHYFPQGGPFCRHSIVFSVFENNFAWVLK